MTIVITDSLSETYKQPELDNLWGVLSDKSMNGPKGYNPVGLVEVAFDIPMDVFRDNCDRKMFEHVPWVNYALISRSIPNCFDFFLGKRIMSHGLCCAAEFKSPTNTAISIYLMNHGTHEISVLVLPGVNYVPTLEEIQELKGKWRINDIKYQEWINMIERYSTTSRDFSPA